MHFKFKLFSTIFNQCADNSRFVDLDVEILQKNHARKSCIFCKNRDLGYIGVDLGGIWGGFGVDFRIVLPWSILTVLAILGNFGTFLLKVMLAGEDFSKRLLNDPSEIAERSRDHSRDTLAISAAILEQRII